MGESALGTLAGLQFASTIADPILPAELTWFMAMTEQVIGQVTPVVDGSIVLTESPSLAALMDWKAFELNRQPKDEPWKTCANSCTNLKNYLILALDADRLYSLAIKELTGRE